jgi:quercetin dioxygenase-like cupin family protein
MRTLVMWTLSLALIGGVALAQEQVRLAPQEIELPPPAAAGQPGTSGVAGTQLKLMSGNPKAGFYTMMIVVPPHTVIKPHSHPDNRVGVVVSGTWYFAFGEKFDEAQLKALPPGSFYTEPPNATHFAVTRDEAVSVYITGTGPTGTTYPNPADDPFKK